MDKELNSPNLKGTWNQALATFLFPILLVFGVRWAIVEPYVIPSGSMIPNLLIHDHILVKKFSFGLHVPFSTRWLSQWSSPKRGDVVVFRFPENPDVYYIKRLIGLPGDTVEVQGGRIRVNEKDFDLAPEGSPQGGEDFYYFKESNGERPYMVRFSSDDFSSQPVEVFRVPQGEFFFMGDNRDHSSDSRVWGFVKNELIVGKAWFVWLSCYNTLPTMSFVCDPSQIKWNRIFQKVD